MNNKRSEMKWAAWGFAGGFLVCYTLMAAFGGQRAPAATNSTKSEVELWKLIVSTSVVDATNLRGPVMRTGSPRAIKPLPGLTPVGSNQYYQLDWARTNASAVNATNLRIPALQMDSPRLLKLSPRPAPPTNRYYYRDLIDTKASLPVK